MSILFFVNDLFLLGELPYDLKYLEPEPLLKTEGLSWQFQRSDELMNTFKDALLSHYENFISKRIDKISIPIYLILAGSGTGKSRIATELPQLAKDCAVNNPELQERLESALVFNISFEILIICGFHVFFQFCSFKISNTLFFNRLLGVNPFFFILLLISSLGF